MTLTWVVYVIGVVLVPIVAGMIGNSNEAWSIKDDCLPLFFLSLLWPVLLALVVGFALVGLVCIALGGVWWCLLMVGVLIAQLIKGAKKDSGNG